MPYTPSFRAKDVRFLTREFQYFRRRLDHIETRPKISENVLKISKDVPNISRSQWMSSPNQKQVASAFPFWEGLYRVSVADSWELVKILTVVEKDTFHKRIVEIEDLQNLLVAEMHMWASNWTDSREIAENLINRFQPEIQTSSKIGQFGDCHLPERLSSSFWLKFTDFSPVWYIRNSSILSWLFFVTCGRILVLSVRSRSKVVTQQAWRLFGIEYVNAVHAFSPFLTRLPSSMPQNARSNEISRFDEISPRWVNVHGFDDFGEF